MNPPLSGQVRTQNLAGRCYLLASRVAIRHFTSTETPSAFFQPIQRYAEGTGEEVEPRQLRVAPRYPLKAKKDGKKVGRVEGGCHYTKMRGVMCKGSRVGREREYTLKNGHNPTQTPRSSVEFFNYHH